MDSAICFNLWDQVCCSIGVYFNPRIVNAALVESIIMVADAEQLCRRLGIDGVTGAKSLIWMEGMVEGHY